MFLFFIISNVSFSLIEKIAYLWADKEWGYKHLERVLPYYDPEGNITAYAFIFSDGTELDPYLRRFPYIQDEDEEYHRKRIGYEVFGTVVVSATYSKPPVLEVSNCLPLYYTRRHIVGNQNLKLIYISPSMQWYESGGELISLYNYPRITLEELRESSNNELNYLTSQFRSEWDRYSHTERVDVKEYNMVEGVPAFTWSYGCSPTASAMIMGYWDDHGYDRFIDYYFDRYELVEKNQDFNVPNVQQELAIAMHTDTVHSGGTSWNAMCPAHQAVGTENGYEVSCNMYECSSGNGWGYEILKGEIDEGSPVHWAVGNYYHPYFSEPIYHSVCAIGYEITDEGDTLFIIYNTWDTGVHKWRPYTTEYGTSFAYLYTAVPEGREEYNIDVLIDESFTVFDGFQYHIPLKVKGSPININVWFAPNGGGDLVYWDRLTTINDDDYIYYSKGDSGRLNFEFVVNRELKAADGMRYKFTGEELQDFGLNVGYHCGISSIESFSFDYPYFVVATSRGNIYLYKIADIPLLVNKFNFSARSVDIDSERKILAFQDYKGNVFIYNFRGESVCEFTGEDDKGMNVTVYKGRYIFSFLKTQGIKVYDIETGALVNTVPFNGSYIMSVKIYDDTLYVAHSKGVDIFDVVDVSNIHSVHSVSVGAVNDILKEDDVLLIAKGTKSIIKYNIQDGSMDTLDINDVNYLTSLADTLYFISNSEVKKARWNDGDISLLNTYTFHYNLEDRVMMSKGILAIPTDVGIFFCKLSSMGIKKGGDDTLLVSVKRNIIFISDENNIIEIYNIAGRKIFEDKNRRIYRLNLSSGIYFYMLKIGGKIYKGKFTIFKR